MPCHCHCALEAWCQASLQQSHKYCHLIVTVSLILGPVKCVFAEIGECHLRELCAQQHAHHHMHVHDACFHEWYQCGLL